LIKLPPYILFEKYIYILALEMASPGKQHGANCIGTLSFNIFLMRKQTKAQNLVDRSFNNLFFRNFVKNPPPSPTQLGEALTQTKQLKQSTHTGFMQQSFIITSRCCVELNENTALLDNIKFFLPSSTHELTTDSV